MRSKLLRFSVVAIALILTPAFLTAAPSGNTKSVRTTHSSVRSKHKASRSKHRKNHNLATQRQANARFQKRLQQRMEMAESTPGKLSSARERGPLAVAIEDYQNRAFPASEIPIALTEAAKQSFDQDDSESENGNRGEKIHTRWTSLGPTVALYPAVTNRFNSPYVASGRISALAIAPNCNRDECRLYVGAAGGGVWRTDNALSKKPEWEFTSARFATNAVGTLTIDPTDSDSQTIYAGTGEPNASGDSEAGLGIYKSTDGGDSWMLLPGSSFAKNRSISSIVIDPTNANTIYVGTTRGVRGVGSVGGATGNPPSPTPVGVYKSTDGGNTFSLIFDPSPITPGGFTEGVNEVALDPNNSAIVYAGAFGLGIFRSSPAEGGGAFQRVFVSLGFDLDPNIEDSFSRTNFSLTTKNGQTRMYAGDGGGSGPPAQNGAAVWRNDNINQPAFALVVGGTNAGGWKVLTSSTVADPGYAAYNYCTGQCWYDNAVLTPAGQPDTVFVIGSFSYNEFGGRSNGRAVLRSTTAGEPDPANNNRTFTDVTVDATSSTAPNGIHPDQHTLVFAPGNPNIWFEGSDGGLMRSSGIYTDISSQCGGRGLPADKTLLCKRVLSAVPTLLTSLNTGLDTLQFQSLSINPKNPTGELLGGTQDNGTFLFQGSRVLWPQTIGGDGGQSGFNAATPNVRFHTFFIQQVDVNFRGSNPLGWDWVSDPLFTGEGSSFYIPIIADPNPAKAGSMFAGLQGVWRTTDNGGDQATLDLHCNEFSGDFTITCGDWVELASSTGQTTSQGRLTSAFYGNRLGGVVAATTRAAGDTATLWAATTRGRVFISKNADSVSSVPGADGSLVRFTRIDSLAANSPGRFVSGIYVDPANSNHAWISYSGYNMNTPSQPGHVFSVTFDPVAGTAVWTNLDGGTGPMGDLPVTALVRDDPTGDLYAATDFGVLRLPSGGTAWQTAGSGLPRVEVPGLSISTSARVLYAATHGRGAYVLTLPQLGGSDDSKHHSGNDGGDGNN